MKNNVIRLSIALILGIIGGFITYQLDNDINSAIILGLVIFFVASFLLFYDLL